jgi:hypothetical protein
VDIRKFTVIVLDQNIDVKRHSNLSMIMVISIIITV